MTDRFRRLGLRRSVKFDVGVSLDQLVRMMEDLHLSIKELTKGKMHLPAYRALYLDKMLEGQEAAKQIFEKQIFEKQIF